MAELQAQVEVAKRQVQELSKFQVMTATAKGQETSCQSVADQSTDSLEEAQLLSSTRYQINLLPASQRCTVPDDLVSLLVLLLCPVSTGRLPALSWTAQWCHQTVKSHHCLSSGPRGRHPWRVSTLPPSRVRHGHSWRAVPASSRMTSRLTPGARPAQPGAALPSTSP